MDDYDPYDFDLGGNSKKSKTKRRSKTKKIEAPKSNSSAMEKAGFYLKKYGANKLKKDAELNGNSDSDTSTPRTPVRSLTRSTNASNLKSAGDFAPRFSSVKLENEFHGAEESLSPTYPNSVCSSVRSRKSNKYANPSSESDTSSVAETKSIDLNELSSPRVEPTDEYVKVMKEMEEEEENRRKEAMFMLAGESENDVYEEENDDDSYFESMREAEEKMRREEALAMIHGATQSNSEEENSQGVVFEDSNRQDSASAESENDNATFEESDFYDDSFSDSHAVKIPSMLQLRGVELTPLVIASRKSPTTVASESGEPLTALSYKTKASIKSVKTGSSSRSKWSPRSNMSPRTRRLLSPGSPADDYSFDGFESEIEGFMMVDKSTPRPRSPLQKSQLKEISSKSKISTKTVGTQYVETRDSETQSNLVVSAGGVVYEVPSTAWANQFDHMNAPSMLYHGPPVFENQPHKPSIPGHHPQTTGTFQSHNSNIPLHYPQATHSSQPFGFPYYKTGHSPSIPSSYPHASSTYASVYASSMNTEANQHVSNDGRSYSNTSHFENTANRSMLQATERFRNNLEMMRQQLEICRMTTDNSLREGAPSRTTNGYSTFSDFESYVKTHRPHVRTVNEAMNELY